MDFIEPGSNQIVAMFLEEGFHRLGVELAAGHAKTLRKLLGGLEDRVGKRDGGFHEPSITPVIPATPPRPALNPSRSAACQEKEKRLVGALWEKRSGGKGLYLMAQKSDEKGRDVREQLLAKIAGG